MTPDLYCQSKAALPGSELHYSFLFLSADKRRAATALYALLSELAEISDGDPLIAPIRFAWWRGEIEAMLRGTPQHPVTRALAPGSAQYALRRAWFEEILCETETTDPHHRFATFSELESHFLRIAGPAAKLATTIFGHCAPSTLAWAEKLAVALQLAEIIVDVGRDSLRSRVNLALEELLQYGLRQSDILNRRDSEAFRRLMEFQIARAERGLRETIAELPAIDRKTQRPWRIRASIAIALLAEIALEPGAVLRQRVALTPLRKLWIACRTY